MPSAEVRKNAGGQVGGRLQAVDSKGEQTARMFLEPQVGLRCVTCRVAGSGGSDMGKTTHRTAR